MGRKNILFIICIILLVLTSISEYGYAIEDPTGDRSVYIIVINKLTLSDMDKMPDTRKLIDNGNLGLMNTRGTGSYKGAEGFATINSSNKTYANNEGSQFYNLNDEYLKLYENRIGPLDGKYDIGNIGVGRLYNQNEGNKYAPYIGALGDSLHDKGYKTAIFGNGDTEENIDRTSALIAMDSRGLIDYGNLDSILIEDARYPYGYRTNYDKILGEMDRVKENASLIVVETGDLMRLSGHSNYLSREHFIEKKNLILMNIDKFIGDMVKKLDKEKSLLMILSPNSGEGEMGDSKLSPIILWGKDIQKGTVTSSTTNRDAIISNLDIGPTVADFLDSTPMNMLGNPIKIIKSDSPLDYIRSINRRINTTSRIRSRVLLFYAIISIAISILASLAFWFNMEFDRSIVKSYRILLLFLYGIPLMFILNSLFPNTNIFKFVLSITIVFGAYGLFIIKYNSGKTMVLLSLLTFLIIVIDLLFNGIITRFSVFSHDPTIGARYFGIGNELMGIFLAVAALVTGILFKRYNSKVVAIVFLILSTILIGHPGFGANVGGTIAILTTTMYFILEVMGKRLSLKNIIITILITIVFIMAIGYIDIKLNPNPTHLGRSLTLLNEKGSIIAYNIIYRKLAMNLTLLRTSIWTKVLFASILAQLTMVYKKRDRLSNLISGRMGKGISSGIIGATIGCLLNDSGIMLAAICMNLITIFILFFILEEKEIY